MAAFDKIVEDSYAYLKQKWWGIPLVVLAVISSSAFAVWNSLPNSVKERLLSSKSPSVSDNAGAQAKSPQQISDKIDAQRAPSPPQPSLKYRNATQEAQVLLKALGYDIPHADGFEGPRTTAALESFQKQHSLPITGAADDQTLAVLRSRAAKAFLRKDQEGG